MVGGAKISCSYTEPIFSILFEVNLLKRYEWVLLQRRSTISYSKQLQTDSMKIFGLAQRQSGLRSVNQYQNH